MINRKQFGILIALALGAGFVGGVVGSFFFTGEMVFAEKTKEGISGVIEAKEFRVVDDDGKILAHLGKLGNSEETGLFIRADGEGGITSISNGKGGGPSLAIFEGEGSRGLNFNFRKEGPSLTLYDHTGGTPKFSLFSFIVKKSGQLESTKVDIAADLEKGSSLILRDLINHIVIGTKKPRIEIYNEKGKAIFGSVDLVTKKTGVVHKHPPSSINLFNNDGDVIWSAP